MRLNKGQDGSSELWDKVCTNCGKPNNTTALHCRYCSARLPQTLHKKPQYSKTISALLNRILSVIVIALLAAGALALWPAVPYGKKGESENLVIFYNKTNTLKQRRGISQADHAQQGVTTRKTQTGVVFSESEANTYLEFAIASNAESGSRRFSVRTAEAANIDFGPDNIIFTALTRVMVLPITWQFIWTSDVMEDGIVLKLKRIRIGHLPLPCSIMSAPRRLFSPLFQEIQKGFPFSPDELRIVALTDDTMRIIAGPEERFPDKATNTSVQESRNTLLHAAVLGSDKEPVKQLLNSTSDVNPRNSRDMTPLHLCLEKGNLQIVSLLLEAGADVNARDDRGMTPMHYAVSRADTHIIGLLLSYGCQINAKDDEGQTPLDWSHFRAKSSMIKFLTENGGKRGSDSE